MSENIKKILETIKSTEGDKFEYNEEAISKDLSLVRNTSITIKILTFLGSALASLTVIVLLFLSEIVKNEVSLLIAGGIFVVASLFINKKSDNNIHETFSMTGYISGVILVGAGITGMRGNENVMISTFFILSIISLSITQNYIISFLNALMFLVSLIYFIIINEVHDLVHLFISINVFSLLYIIKFEAKVININKFTSKLYDPIRIALIISLVFALTILANGDNFKISPKYIYLSSFSLGIAIAYMISMVFDILKIKSASHKNIIYFMSSLILLSIVFAPSILGAIFIILMSFYVNYKTGLILGIISLIYFISRYYYYMDITLLMKSVILIASGVLFITFYAVLSRGLSKELNSVTIKDKETI